MNNKYLPWAIVVVLIAVVGWMILGPDDDLSEMMDDNSKTEVQDEVMEDSDDVMTDDGEGAMMSDDEPAQTSTEEEVSVGEVMDDSNTMIQADGTLTGTLQNSDDESKGNLMLVQNKNTLYINTGRDFSELVGKEVVVKIDGTLESFALLSIEAK